MARCQVPAAQVVSTLKKHILADGFHVIIDLEKSHGSFIHDAVTGKEILDFYSYFASLPVGHNHPKIVGDAEFLRALQLATIANPANSDIYTTAYAGFVEAFARIAKPECFKYLFFVAGGALAVENALKTAFDWKVRKNRAAGKGDLGTKIIHFREAFHGRSGYTMSLTNTDPVKTDAFPKFDWPRITNPKLTFPVTDEVRGQVIEAEKQAEREIEASFAKFPDDIAAIIIEPIQGEGGDNHFRPEFFHALRRLADAHDALLIFDEVQTGVGLTGKMWAHEHFGVRPDIIAFGKKAQVCGIMVSDRIDDVPDNVFHVPGRINSTWGGNLADMVRGARYLEIIEEDSLVENADRAGDHLLGGLTKIASEWLDVTNVRGRGLFVAFTLPSTKLRNDVRQTCWDLGLATLASGATSIRFRPCLNVSGEEIDLGLGILRRALERHLPKRAEATNG
ncbi:MAG: L-lysine 6-transaminase [Polyangiaceae bacterium]|nr:L-lysine 6-transaminase [Polyangiaceae bacterium]